MLKYATVKYEIVCIKAVQCKIKSSNLAGALHSKYAFEMNSSRLFTTKQESKTGKWNKEYVQLIKKLSLNNFLMIDNKYTSNFQ